MAEYHAIGVRFGRWLGGYMGAKTVLIADDESHILNVVSMKLRNAGYRVVIARDGREAYELARQERPDLIITDFQMPELSGLELFDKLKQENGNSMVPTIMLTARSHCLDEAQLSARNFVRLLSKPFSPRQLLATVNEIFQASQSASIAAEQT